MNSVELSYYKALLVQAQDDLDRFQSLRDLLPNRGEAGLPEAIRAEIAGLRARLEAMGKPFSVDLAARNRAQASVPEPPVRKAVGHG